MTWYRSVWLCGTLPIAALGVFGALIAAPLVKLASLALVVVIVATSMAWACGVRPTERIVGTGLIAMSATVVAVGLGALLGGVAVLPLLIVAALSPPVVNSSVRRLALARSSLAHPAESEPTAPSRAGTAVAEVRQPVCRPRRPPGSRATHPARQTSSTAPSNDRPAFLTDSWMTQPPTTMDGATLCLAWRKTSTVLVRDLSLSVVETLVRRRQDLLDEMERRNGKGFQAWLASGARAAGDPSRYIVES